MQTAQTIIKDYRRKRVIVCVTVALVTLVLTLGIRFISQRNINQDRITTLLTTPCVRLIRCFLR